MQKLFTEFEGTNSQKWKDQIVKDLKGIDFNQLIWKTHNGISVNPFYTSEDIKEKKEPLFSESDWDICEHILVKDEKQANQRAFNALKNGASGLSFYIHQKINTAALIKDISLEHIYSNFFISNDALHVLEDLKNIYGTKNAFENKLKCFVNIDPICLYAYYGEWHDNQEADMEVLNKLVHIPLNASLYEEAGASTVNELAFALSHVNEYFNFLNEKGNLKDKTIHAIFSVAPDFFTEIAKLRAFRKLVALLQESYGTNFPLHIHAQTAQLDKSAMDVYTNMLRTTTEAMSAVIGGANSVSVLPYNEGFSEVNEFSSRIARNQQHILKDESYLNKVNDIAAGSYYIESITDQLAEKAWEQFKSIEAKGGFIACLKNNFIQTLISEGVSTLIHEVKEGKLVLVGVNKFQNKAEKVAAVPEGLSVKNSQTEITPIRPIRLAKSFEVENFKSANPLASN
ncbi:MAG TPA: methylmalonyl-CoA mutase subunit beta [Bacteroidia bacterium]|nr:methylmalonyl-CoA mutase subunit beta [Bacteroidia bacterium]